MKETIVSDFFETNSAKWLSNTWGQIKNTRALMPKFNFCVTQMWLINSYFHAHHSPQGYHELTQKLNQLLTHPMLLDSFKTLLEETIQTLNNAGYIPSVCKEESRYDTELYDYPSP